MSIKRKRSDILSVEEARRLTAEAAQKRQRVWEEGVDKAVEKVLDELAREQPGIIDKGESEFRVLICASFLERCITDIPAGDVSWWTQLCCNIETGVAKQLEGYNVSVSTRGGAYRIVIKWSPPPPDLVSV